MGTRHRSTRLSPARPGSPAALWPRAAPAHPLAEHAAVKAETAVIAAIPSTHGAFAADQCIIDPNSCGG